MKMGACICRLCLFCGGHSPPCLEEAVAMCCGADTWRRPALRFSALRSSRGSRRRSRPRRLCRSATASWRQGRRKLFECADPDRRIAGRATCWQLACPRMPPPRARAQRCKQARAARRAAAALRRCVRIRLLLCVKATRLRHQADNNIIQTDRQQTEQAHAVRTHARQALVVPSGRAASGARMLPAS